MYVALGQPTPAVPAVAQVPLTRVWINELPPFSNVCRIVARMHGTSKISVGTGFLISPHHVATAAHVLFPPEAPNTKSITVYPGQNDEKDPRGIKADSWARHPQHQSGNICTGNLDFGIIRLSEPVRAGHFELRTVDVKRLAGMAVTLAGYPEGKSDKARLMFRSEGQLIGVRPDADCRGQFTFIHTADSRRSMSGGPLWSMIDGVRTVVGIHVSHTDWLDARQTRHRDGRAVIFTQPMIEQYRRWMAHFRPLPR